MKKIFSLFATALVALFGLTCCGGGGDSSEPGYMSIQDFYTGTKKFVTGYNLVMQIIPNDGAADSDSDPFVTSVDDTSVNFRPGWIKAGDAEISAYFTYAMPEKDARTATLTFSVTGSVEDLTDKDFLAGLGFAVLATDESAGTAIVLPNTITSLSGMNCVLEFNFDAQKMETTVTFVNVKVTENGNTVPYSELVRNGVVPFTVCPQ